MVIKSEEHGVLKDARQDYTILEVKQWKTTVKKSETEMTK